MSIWQTAWRNLMRRKLRTMLTLMSIVIGVGAAFGVIASVDTAERTFPLYLEKTFGKANFTISGTEAYFPEGVHKEVQVIPETESIALLKQSTKLHLEQEGISAIQKRVDLSGYSDMATPLTGFQLIEGNLAAGGAIITDRTAAVWKTVVGDTLSFDTEDGRKTIEITAIVKYTPELMGPSNWMMAKFHPWSVAVPLSVVQDWFDLHGKVQNIQVKSLADSQNVQLQAEAIVKRNEDLYLQPVVVDFEAESNQLNTFFLALYVAGFLGIVLSAFVIFNSLYVSIKERKNEFAALKTIGYTQKQIHRFVLAEVIILSTAGTVIGLAFGYGLAFLLKEVIFMLSGVNDEGALELTKAVLISILAGILVPLAASFYPIRQAGRISVIQAINENAAATDYPRKWQGVVGMLLIGSSFFIKHILLVVPLLIGVAMIYPYLFQLFIVMIKPLYALLFGFSGKVAVRNLGRNLARTSMTSIVMCLGIIMIVLMSSLNSALIQSYERVIYASYGGNLDIMLHHIEKTDLAELKSIKGVKDAQTYRMHAAIWLEDDQKRRLNVYGVEADWIDRFPLFTATDSKQSDLIKSLGKNEIVMSKVTYSMWGGKLGDTIALQTNEGTQSFKVTAVVQTMKNSGYGVFMREGDFTDSFGLKYEKNALVLKENDTSPLQLRESIFNHFGSRIMEMFGPEDWVSVIGAVYTGSFAMINLLVILSVIISGIGITNTMLINIIERIRELGMMRAVGVTRRQLVRMVMLEGFGTGLVATFIGCLFGILLIYLTSTFVEINTLSYQFGVPANIMLIISIFGIVISLLSSLTPALKAAKTQLGEALRYE